MSQWKAIDQQVRRWICKILGHRWVKAECQPVLGPFDFCWRCGKWER